MKGHLAVLQILGVLAVTGAPQAAAQSANGDLTGSWDYSVRLDDPASNHPGWQHATVSVLAGGTVGGGSVFDSDGFGGAVTGGSVALTGNGAIAGSLTFSPGGTESFAGFQLEAGKTWFVGVDNDSHQIRSLTIATRDGGTFGSGDVVGTWYLFGHWDSPVSNDPGWDRGSFTTSSGGTVTSGTVTDSDGAVDSLVGLKLGIDAAGLVSVNTGDPVTVLKMDPHKNLISGVNTAVDGYRSLLVVVKGGGSFSTADLGGRWYTYAFRDRPGTNAPEWDRGSLVVLANGSVTGGSSVDSHGAVSAVTGGALSIDAQGVVGGSLTAGGSMRTYPQFKMDRDRSVIVGVRTDASGDREFHVLLKAPTWVDLGRGLAGALGVPSLVGGGTLVGGTPWSLSLTHAFPATTAFYLIGFSELYAPFRGGVLVPAFDLFVPLPTGPGTLNLNLNSWPPGLPQGASIFFQVWIGDPGGPAGFAASNAVSGTSA